MDPPGTPSSFSSNHLSATVQDAAISGGGGGHSGNDIAIYVPTGKDVVAMLVQFCMDHGVSLAVKGGTGSLSDVQLLGETRTIPLTLMIERLSGIVKVNHTKDFFPVEVTLSGGFGSPVERRKMVAGKAESTVKVDAKMTFLDIFTAESAVSDGHGGGHHQAGEDGHHHAGKGGHHQPEESNTESDGAYDGGGHHHIHEIDEQPNMMRYLDFDELMPVVMGARAAAEVERAAVNTAGPVAINETSAYEQHYHMMNPSPWGCDELMPIVMGARAAAVVERAAVNTAGPVVNATSGHEQHYHMMNPSPWGCDELMPIVMGARAAAVVERAAVNTAEPVAVNATTGHEQHYHMMNPPPWGCDELMAVVMGARAAAVEERAAVNTAGPVAVNETSGHEQHYHMMNPPPWGCDELMAVVMSATSGGRTSSELVRNSSPSSLDELDVDFWNSFTPIVDISSVDRV